MNALTSFLYFEIFEDCELLGQKYYERAKRLKLRELKKIKDFSDVKTRPTWKYYKFVEEIQEGDLGDQIQDPDTLEKNVELTDEEHDSIWESIINLFSEYELYNLIEKAAKRLKNPKPQIQFLTAKSLTLTKSTIPQALEIINKLIESDEDNFNYLYEKGKIYFI